MIFSKRVQELQTIYQLTAQDVFFSMLVAAGASRGESYAIIYRPTAARVDTISRAASQLCRDKAGINKLIESFKAQNGTSLILQEDEKNKRKRKKIGENGEEVGKAKKYRDKNAIIQGLEESLTYLHGKEKADVLMKIADLQQLKKEKTEEDEKVLYYLPLQCYNCELYNKAKEIQAIEDENKENT